jgi:lipopolysaccharide/colanic/teichoic acid biosynthesis glycosyltransferase
MTEAALHGAGSEARREPGLPFPVPAEVVRSWELDWDAFLPPQAQRWPWKLQQRVKRMADIVLAALGLLLLLPLLLIVAAAVRLSSPGPILYQWRVLGRHARPFVGYKFRTMIENADALKPEMLRYNEMSGPVFKMRDDPRITSVGRLLRKYSIDELPQLWSVLKGDMSLVGPRPPSPQEFASFAPHQRAKLAVTPGITCLWQVSGRSHITDFERWVQLDLDYIRDWNLLRDAAILVRTLPAVMRGDGAY